MKNIFKTLLAAVLGIVLYGIYAMWTLITPVNTSGTIHLTVHPKDSISVIAKNAKMAGIVRDAWVTQLYLRTLNTFSRIKTGEYDIEPGTNEMQIGFLFLHGVPKQEKIVRIIEGWTISQIAEYLQGEDFPSANSVLRSTLSGWAAQLPYLKDMPRGALLEGFYFPDTYRVFAGVRAEDVTLKALTNFETKALPLFPVGTPTEKIYETVILASILEKEVASDFDRAMVADIFYRRMDAGIPLQSDATVNYVTGKNALQPTLDDTKTDSAYNTYRVKGLPPSPICNPGISSIEAALHPRQNAYLFFLTTKDGSVIFSKTYEEHLRNKQKYLL